MHNDRDSPRFLERMASVGIARSDVEIGIVDENGGRVAQGEPGEVIVRGDVVMNGYWENPEASAQTLKGGWLHTGDVGVLSGEGFLTLKDRTKDMIISGGTNIYPREVEEVLLQHDAVLEVSVVGRPHADWGEEVVAFVVQRSGMDTTEEDLDRFCLENMTRFKRPKHYRFLQSLPKNNYGKTLKTTLRDLLSTGKHDPRE
jgi:long-chain acyl-CoA synthetase